MSEVVCGWVAEFFSYTVHVVQLIKSSYTP